MKPQVHFKQDALYQLLLIFIAVGTHPYLAGMVVPLSAALYWKCYRQKKCNFYYAVTVFIGNLLFSLLCAWIFGWFLTSAAALADSGFGLYSSNLLSFINPMYGSILLQALPEGYGQYEGYAYLGLGLIVPLIGVFFLSFYRKSHFYSKDYFVLIVILSVYFIFALSNVVQIGPHRVTLFNIKHFPRLSSILGVFRSSGRFIWPVFYFVQFFILIKVYDAFPSSSKKRNIILVLLLALQVSDNSFLIEKVKKQWSDISSKEITVENIPPAIITSNLKSTSWLNLSGKHIKHLFILHDIQSDILKISFDYIALKNHATINDANIARSKNGKMDAYYQEQYDNFLKGQLLPNTLYIGLKNEKFYPQKYCSMLDGYVICSAVPSFP